VDLTDTIVPKSDQLNADDLLSGPRTFTVTEVRLTGAEDQPVAVHLAEFPGRPFKPSKTVRRILVLAWGKDGDAYAGRRMTLYREEAVKFGGQAVGGIRVSHLSHINKPLKFALTETRGKKATHEVRPLASEPATILPVNPPKQVKPNAEALIENAQEARNNADLDAVARAAAGLIGDELDAVKAVVTARRAELKEAADTEPTLPGAEQ